MKRLLRWILWGVAGLLVCAGLLVAYVFVASSRDMAKVYTVTPPALTVPSDEATIARGKYLVTKVSMCTECHGDDLGGKMVTDNAAMGRLAGSNLTRGRGGKGASYSDADFVRTLMHGVRPDGRSVIFMPSADYRFTNGDLAAVIAYVKSVPPVDRELPPASVGPMARALYLFAGFPLLPAMAIDHANVRFEAEHSSDPVAAGAALVASGGCRGCHGPDLVGGGGPPPGAANITPVGIGDWTEADFMTALRTHKRPNGTTINEAMPLGYGQMSDDDLRNLFAYLKTIPAKGEKSANQRGN
jgi:mono/diheme cytochrome c family protein